MKKRNLLFCAAVLIALLLYFRPMPFPELSFDEDGNLWIQKVDLSIAEGTPHMVSTVYSFAEDSPEAEAIGEILNCYSFRRSLGTPFRIADITGNDAGFFFFLWGDDLYLSSGGTGKIVVNDRTFRMGLLGNQKNLAFMEEIAAVLAEAEPHEAP